MASIKVKFRPSTVNDHEGTIYYQIIHERCTRQLLTEYHVFPTEWDEQRSMVSTACSDERVPFILALRERIRWDVERLTKIIRRLDNSGLIFTSDDIIEEFRRYAGECSLANFMQTLIIKLKQNGRIRTSETYATTLRSFRRFLCEQSAELGWRTDDDIMLDALTSDIMEAFAAWHRGRGVAPNTVSFYARVLRAVYNRAVEMQLIENRNPFRRVYTGIDKTVKRALPIPVIKDIKALDLTLHRPLDYARDMFLLSFMLRGMSFIDMAFLRKSDRMEGYVIYRRRKTGQQLTIEWTPEMQNILDKYPENDSEYLLPIISGPVTDERAVYRKVGSSINTSLKRIAGMLGLKMPLTMYVARHSWASAARTKGIPISVISEGMGHESENTTRIYLASLDTSLVDRANTVIINAIR